MWFSLPLGSGSLVCGAGVVLLLGSGVAYARDSVPDWFALRRASPPFRLYGAML